MTGYTMLNVEGFIYHTICKGVAKTWKSQKN